MTSSEEEIVETPKENRIPNGMRFLILVGIRKGDLKTVVAPA